MMRTRLLLCWVYGAIALLALVGTWSQNVSYFRPQDGWLLGFVLATGRFWPETLATPASTSITVDLGLFFLAAAIFMVVEARHLDIRLPWLYLILGLLIAISVTFPLFLIARERRFGAQADVATGRGFSLGDRIGPAVCGGASRSPRSGPLDAKGIRRRAMKQYMAIETFFPGSKDAIDARFHRKDACRRTASSTWTAGSRRTGTDASS